MSIHLGGYGWEVVPFGIPSQMEMGKDGERSASAPRPSPPSIWELMVLQVSSETVVSEEPSS